MENTSRFDSIMKSQRKILFGNLTFSLTMLSAVLAAIVLF